MGYLSNSHRKFAAAAITASLVATAVAPAYAASYTDVSNRYEEAVDYLVENQITNGITASDFGTSQSIKRADVAVMLAKALKLDVSKAKDSGFTDVPKRAKAYVDALKETGIINGKTAVSFASDQEITRGEAAIMLAKAYHLTGDKTKNVFTDVSSRYTEAVSALVTHQITEGKTKTSFGTDQAITRGEFAIFLHKLSKLDDAAVSEATVKNETELKAALENNAIKKIFLAESFKIASTVVVRNVEIDLNGQTLTGDLSYDSIEKADILLKSTKVNGKLAGTLTVNTPNADFTVGENVEITGGVIIRNVKASTFYNRGVLHSVTISDNDGASFANVNRGIVLGTIDLDTAGKVSLIGNIDLVTVNQAATVNIADQAAVKKMVVKVNGTTVDSLKGKIDTIETPQGITVKDSYGKLVETKTENTGSPAILTVANVKNLEQLEAALINERIKTINLTQNIKGVSKQIIIKRAVTVNGKGFTLSFADDLNAAPVNERSGITVIADKVKISDLKIEMPTLSGWQGAYALQVYHSKEVVLNNFTGSGADAALLINGSAVELTGATTVGNNEFGGIEVSKGSEENLPNSELTVTDEVLNEQEATGKPTIWTVDGQGTVKGENVPSHTSSIIKEGQIQYYVTKQPIDGFHAGMIQTYEAIQQAFIDRNHPLKELEAPFLELRNEWDALNEALTDEDLSQLNQDFLATLEMDSGIYIVERFEEVAKLNVEEDYTEASFSKLKEALATSTPESFKQAVEKAGKIDEALSTLVFAAQAELDAAMEKADALNEQDYTVASYQQVKAAIDTAMPKSNQEAIVKVETIRTAISNLVFESQQVLDQTINTARALESKNYTEESFEELERVLNIPDPTSNQLAKDKNAAIIQAINGLVLKQQEELKPTIQNFKVVNQNGRDLSFTWDSYKGNTGYYITYETDANSNGTVYYSFAPTNINSFTWRAEDRIKNSNNVTFTIRAMSPTGINWDSLAKFTLQFDDN